MSEQQTATAVQATTTSACPHPEAVGKRWGDPISEERQAELRALFERQKEWVARSEAERGDSPFQDVQLRGADVCWLAEQSGQVVYGIVPNLHLEGAILVGAHLEGASIVGVHLEGAYLRDAHLERASLGLAHLERADLVHAHLERADLGYAHLEGAIVANAHLEGANLLGAYLEGANLRNAWMDKTTLLNNAALDRASLDQLSFDGANLAVVKWEAVKVLGDEVQARAGSHQASLAAVIFGGRSPGSRSPGKRKDRQGRLDGYEAAVRAHLQLAAVLRSQGMAEQADRFTYQAQKLQRMRYRVQRRFGQWLFSVLLFLMAGYGYRIGRIIIAYAIIVAAFAAAFLASDVVSGQSALSVPSALDAMQISLNAIHGRVFFAQFGLDTLQSWLATAESIVGIVVEGVFVAMLIQKFFGR
jgi:uncharacterized protein YjbI with pentapeptide repeats